MSKRVGSAKERSVFVGNIPYDVTEDQLKEIFSGAGTVVNFRLVTDRETGKPKGYGFCEYADGATALSAMRNLNGYEVNGRNLRVDFADGGDKSSSSGGGGGGSGGGHYHDNKHTASVSGEAIIKAIEGAISRFGPLKLYDMLVELKEHARQRPEHTKAMLSANPALTHALIQSFKTLNIPLPMTPEQPPTLVAGLPPPPPRLHAMPPYSRAMVPPPQRSPLTASGPPGGGILGMAPPMGPPQPPHGPMGQHAPPAIGSVGSVPPPKAGGTRWSSRPGPLAGMMAPPSGPPAVLQPPHQQQPQHTGPPAYQGPPPPQRMAMPPPQQQHVVPPPMQQQPPPSLQQPVNRDPRRARDPRLAKRPRPDEPTAYQGQTQQQQQQQQQANGTFDAIAELARDMTPQKLNLLPPNERQMIVMYMQQHGMAFGS